MYLGDKGVSTTINSSQNEKITTIQYKNIGSRSSKSSFEYCIETTLSPNLLETRFSNKWKEFCPTLSYGMMVYSQLYIKRT